MVLVVPDTYLVSINGESGGQAVTSVIGIEKSFTTASDVTSAVLGAWTQANGPIAKHQNSYIMKDVKAMFLGQADGEVHTRVSAAPGTYAGVKSTNAACALISYGGSSRARTSKGRLYFGPITEGDINNDGRTLTTGCMTGLTSAFNLFRTQLLSGGFTWVVISRKLQSTSAVDSLAVQNILATQRRRIR